MARDNDEMVRVYDADNGPEAELIREELEANDIRAFVNDTPSPLDGLTSMGQGTPVFVSAGDYDKARQVLEEYMAGESED